jgi:hypothetical protein
MKFLDRVFNKSSDISGILESIGQIRKHSDVLNCVFRATGSNWLGVNIAGRSMFPGATIEIPQYHSTQVISDKEINAICDEILKHKFETFVLQGFTPYISKFILDLKKHKPAPRVLLVHHGFISELSDNLLQIQSVNEIVRLCQEGKIDKLGLVKTGHEKLFAELFGIKTALLYNKIPVKNLVTKPGKHDKLHIGVLMNNSFRKNFHTQVVAALLVENAIVHVIDKSELYYLNSRDRIREHGIMPHGKFLDLLTSMDINLHVTFSESFGGQVFTESLGSGIPCLSGYSNGFLDNDPQLTELLCVKEMDDPLAIKSKIDQILHTGNGLGEKLIEYCTKMNRLADESLQEFLRES